MKLIEYNIYQIKERTKENQIINNFVLHSKVKALTRESVKL